MQDIENDMDDLFRRAGENYPLKKSKGDWESVLKKMPVPGDQELTLKKQTKKDSRKIFILFLLAVILILSGLLIYNLDPKLKPLGKLATSKEVKKNIEDKDSPKNSQAENKPASKGVVIRNQSTEIHSGRNKKTLQLLSFASNNNVNNLSLQKDGKTANENRIGNANYSFIRKSDFNYHENNFPLSTHEIEPKKNIQIDSNAISSLAKKKLIIKMKPRKENGFYVGINAGPDFSKVKSGNFQSPGFSAGIVLGYQINKKIFAETEFSIGNKYYSSGGKLFNEEGAAMPDGMVIMDLQGYSRIIEIPVKIGYDIYAKKKESVFISAGLSAYIMTMEKNNYNVTMNGNPEKMVGLYEKSNVKTPATFNLSAGWEHQLTGKMHIRIEPYLKLPLQGIGVGKLPVTSTGIQVGIYRMIK